MPADLEKAFAALKPGQVSTVVRRGSTCLVARIDALVEDRRLTLEDDWDAIAAKAADIAGQQKVIDLVGQWRRGLFIDIRL